MSNFLLALWIALIGADRIDFAGGHGPFILTPFLALTPLVVVSELIRRRAAGNRVLMPGRMIGYTTAAALLMSVALASVFVAADLATSASRAMLLVADLLGTLIVVLLIADRADAWQVLARGAVVGLVLCALFDVGEVLYFIGRGPDTLHLGMMSANFANLQLAPPFPRLAGTVADSNRGAFVLVFQTVLIAFGEPRPWLRRACLAAAVLLFLPTISRSGTLDALAVLVTLGITTRRLLSPRVILGGALLVGAVTALALVEPNVADAERLDVITSRLSTSQGSAPEHLRLIERGLREATRSVPRTLLGLGYGSSYLVLQDIFPGSRYGNFHSLYVSMFAEAGVVALLLTLVLMLIPVAREGPLRALVIGAATFNLFYQAGTEPAFWFILALAWLTMGVGARSGVAPVFWRWNVTPTLSPLTNLNPSK